MTLLKFSEMDGSVWKNTEGANFYSSDKVEWCSSVETLASVKYCITVGRECRPRKFMDLYATKSIVTLP